MTRIRVPALLLLAALVIVSFDQSSSWQQEVQWGRSLYKAIVQFTSDSGTATIGDRPVRWHFRGGLSGFRWRWKGTVTDVQTGLTGTAKKKSRGGCIEHATYDLAEQLKRRGLPQRHRLKQN